ncbi:hypothetical protein ACWEQL_00055 [Kitasatospora sp. NPDC004240]
MTETTRSLRLSAPRPADRRATVYRPASAVAELGPAARAGGAVLAQPGVGDAGAEPTLGALLAGEFLRLAALIHAAEVSVSGRGGYMWWEKAAEAADSAVAFLCDVVARHGWPGAALIGPEACEAVLLITSRARPDARRPLVVALSRAVSLGSVPAWHLQRLGAVAESWSTRSEVPA